MEINSKMVPIVELVVEFVLNQIPIARVQVPSGVALNNSAGLAAVTSDDIKPKTKAQIRIKGSGKPHPDRVKAKALPIKDSDDVIFDGYVLSSTVDFNTTGTTTTIVLIHWLYDLDISSFASGDFDKNTPYDWFTSEYSMLSIPNSPNAARVEGGAGGTPVKTETYSNGDWWEDVIKPAMIFKANQRLTNFNTTPPSNNAAAIEVLEKIFSYGGMTLTSKASQSLDEATLTSINELIGSIILTSQGGSSGFEKLMSLLSLFNCVLIPGVKTCKVSPYPVTFLGLTTFKDYEFDFAGGSPNVGLIPAGAILYGVGHSDQIVSTESARVVEKNFVGQFVPTLNGIDGGPFTVFALPNYMSKILRSNLDRGMFKSKVGIVSIYEPANTTAPSLQSQSVAGFADELTKCYYFSKLFDTRTQDIMFGYRLDIAPGNVIILEKDENSNSGSNVSGLANNWKKRGVVESVSIVMSASSNVVRTNVRIRHVMEKQDLDIFQQYLSNTELALFKGSLKVLQSKLLD
jgi:hypothetical protein